MQSALKNKRLWGIIILFLALVTLPYFFAASASGDSHVFGGFLLNPLDGNSYLAKMRQGLNGSWTFTLPYTAEPGEGAYLNLFYIFLGHFAGWLGLPLILTFHLARVIGAIVLLLTLFDFCAVVFDDTRARWLAFLLAAFGSGLGWLTFAFLGLTSDLWVAEAYPFLAAYATPHFAFALALQLWLLTPSERAVWKLILVALLLALISPFGVPVVLVAWGGVLLWQLLSRRDFKATLTRLFWVGLGGVPVLIYDFWVVTTHPVLSGWNAQNLTPSPPLWDLLISLSPALFLVIPGAYYAWRSRRPAYILLLSWLLLCFVLLYVPFGLQRRFLSGYYVVVACLAALVVAEYSSRHSTRFKKVVIPLFVLAIPTNLLVISTAFFGAATHDPAIYLTVGEARAFAWMDANLPDGALVFAAPDTGLFLPVYTDARVLYGHPFETVNAAQQEAAVTSFFSGALSMPQAEDFLSTNHVDYLFFGPREFSLGSIPWLSSWPVVYQSGGVAIYLPPQ